MELRLISTTYEGKERITREQTIPFCDDGGREEQLINLYPQVIYQQMDGFGGAITDSAAYIYSLMNPEQKKQMLDEYFGQGTMKYRFVRIPIDSCDFSLSHYEADGDEADASFESFSFARVEKYILPMLADAEAAYGGRLEIMLSPWSPPAYMKTNGERNHGGKLKACYWKRWAEYICRYVEEYRSRGFNVTMLTLQNEPKAVQTWDSCIYTAQEEKIFLRDYVWPSLAEHNLTDIDIYIWDHNKERAFEWAETIIDAETDHMVAGIAFHWYSGDHFEALRMLRERFAIIMLSGIAFGPEAGFLVGAVSAFASNFFYGQGAYTPWQMFAYGAGGMLAGFLFAKGRLPQKRWVMAAFGFLACVLFVGPLLDTCTVFLTLPIINAQTAWPLYISGFPVNISQGVCTALTMVLFGPALLEKLERVKLQYGMTEDDDGV